MCRSASPLRVRSYTRAYTRLVGCTRLHNAYSVYESFYTINTFTSPSEITVNAAKQLIVSAIIVNGAKANVGALGSRRNNNVHKSSFTNTSFISRACPKNTIEAIN